jgi:hypothetical protein
MDAQAAPIRESLAKMNRAARVVPAVLWLEVLCILGWYAEASETATKISSSISDVGCMGSHVVDFYFFWGMTAAEAAAKPGGRSRGLRLSRAGRRLLHCLRRVRIWARHGPDFVHMSQALQAERSRLRGRTREALALYLRCQQQAVKQGYRHHAALLSERRARLLLALHRGPEAAAAFHQATALYDAWGAAGKAQILRIECAELTRTSPPTAR